MRVVEKCQEWSCHWLCKNEKKTNIHWTDGKDRE